LKQRQKPNQSNEATKDVAFMSYTRVEEDGVEFYTLKSNGASGMSIVGLARLCDINDKTLAQLLNNIARGLVQSKQLKRFVGQDLFLGVKAYKGARIIRAEVCSAIIRYYAFESKVKTKTAQYSYNKFADMGMERWIQDVTGWTTAIAAAEPTFEAVEKFINDRLPTDTLAAVIHPGKILEMLQESSFTGCGYRLYLYMEMLHLQNKQEDIDTICQTLKISRSSFVKWLPKIHEWSHCADWLQLNSREGVEFTIQQRMQQELGGKMEAYTPIGRVDLVTATEIIEIKKIDDWKEALGQVIAKAQTFPKHSKRIHLFGASSKILKKITVHCQVLDVLVTFEKIAPPAAA
jgi:hypothetical protein